MKFCYIFLLTIGFSVSAQAGNDFWLKPLPKAPNAKPLKPMAIESQKIDPLPQMSPVPKISPEVGAISPLTTLPETGAMSPIPMGELPPLGDLPPVGELGSMGQNAELEELRKINPNLADQIEEAIRLCLENASLCEGEGWSID